MLRGTFCKDLIVKFRSPTNEPLHVALTSGHTMVITADDKGIEVPVIFQREAMARGAVLTDEGTAEVRTQTLNRQIVLRETLEAMIKGADKDDFTADGKPNLVRLKAKTGFPVTREEADAAFDEVAAELKQ